MRLEVLVIKEKKMNGRIYSLTLLLALTAGLAGGMLASHFFVTTPVLAAKTSEPKNIVVAVMFVMLTSS